jgi:hypothetical protein
MDNREKRSKKTRSISIGLLKEAEEKEKKRKEKNGSMFSSVPRRPDIFS